MKNDFKEILKIIITTTCLFFIFFIINYFFDNKNTTNNSEFLKKYTFKYKQEFSNVLNVEHKFINIEPKEYENLFDGGYVKFKNIDDNYTFIRGKDEDMALDMNLYQSPTGINLTIWLSEDIYVPITEEEFPDLISAEFRAKYPDVDLTKTFKRNKIENKLDLIFAVLKNLDVEVNEKSTKDQILDKFTFDYLLPLVIPYSNESEINKMILFTGAQYGYVYTMNDIIYISIKKGTQELKIIYQTEDKQTINIDETKIIDVISSIKY